MFSRFSYAVPLLLIGPAGVLAWMFFSGGESAHQGPTSSASIDRPEQTTVREVVVPAGTILTVRLENEVGSATSRIEDPVRGYLDRPVMVDDTTAIPLGSPVLGSVTGVNRSSRVKGRARLAVRFHTVTIGEDKYGLSTAETIRTARATKEEDALKIGIPAAGGAVVGGLVGGKKGAAIGGAVGGGAGTGYVLSTKGNEIRLGKGALVSVKLLEPLTVRSSTGGVCGLHMGVGADSIPSSIGGRSVRSAAGRGQVRRQVSMKWTVA